jgi:hypothetical protein
VKKIACDDNEYFDTPTAVTFALDTAGDLIEEQPPLKVSFLQKLLISLFSYVTLRLLTYHKQPRVQQPVIQTSDGLELSLDEQTDVLVQEMIARTRPVDDDFIDLTEDCVVDRPNASLS